MRFLHRSLASIKPYTTIDGSTIYELLNPQNSEVRAFSVALAVIRPGESTKPHVHELFSEVYFVVRGSGLFIGDGEAVEIRGGDVVYIPPGVVHWVKASGDSELHILCICSPPYSHDATKLAVQDGP